MGYIALEIFDREGTGSQYAALSEDTSITITDTSEIFGSGDVWSHSFTLNAYANAHIVGTAGDIHGARLHEQLHKRKARLWVEGVPLFTGYLNLGDEAEVDADGNIDLTFESGHKTFEDMIEGAKANQVPMMGDVLIGMALWRNRWTRYKMKLEASLAWDSGSTWSGPVMHDGEEEWFYFGGDGEMEGSSVQEYPRMVFPKGSFTNMYTDAAVNIDTLNTDSPYTEDENGTPTHPFCNVALCYQKYGYLKKDENGVTREDYSGDPEAQRGYEYMPANRVNSAPNFYVLYWIRALMKHLGIHIEENQMMDVEDLRRLFFVNTKCAYDEPKGLRHVAYSERFGKFSFQGPGRLVPEYINSQRNIGIDESGFTSDGIVLEGMETPLKVFLKIKEVGEWSDHEKHSYEEKNNLYFNAYATSECFPDVDISEVIKAIENGFGVRFLFSDDYKRVRIVLLRNVFHSNDVQDIVCKTLDGAVKVENSKRGFRMTYGDSEDTHFFYKGFDDKLPKQKPYFVDDSDKHDYSHWNLDADYTKLIHKVSAFDKTCYVTKNTGDGYIIKVDKDAKRYDDLHPSLFGCADFMDAEDGDCTGDAETIEAINVGFNPAIMNDVNFEDERDGKTDKQRFALFVDEQMRARRIDFKDGKDYNAPDTVYDVDGKLYAKEGDEYVYSQMMSDGIIAPGDFAIRSDMYASIDNATAKIGPGGIGALDIKFNFDGHINEGYHLYLQDNFEPNDTGVSPIETHDWGLTLGIMRGSGDDAYVNYFSDPDDGEGNDTWDIVPGSSATAHPDTCDNYGREWFYSDSVIISKDVAADKFAELFPNSNATFAWASSNGVDIYEIKTDDGKVHRALLVTPFPPNNNFYEKRFRNVYISYLNGHSCEEIRELDRAGYSGYSSVLVELDSSYERCDTLRQLFRLGLGYESSIVVDHGVSSRYGRFSLKLRAEKPNPYFDPKKPESADNQRYLEITSQTLKGRGLCDQLYKDYSYFVRNARIIQQPVHMELAQLLSIDKTKRARVGDVTGLIRKMQYTVSNKTGLGDVTMEIMYI